MHALLIWTMNSLSLQWKKTCVLCFWFYIQTQWGVKIKASEIIRAYRDMCVPEKRTYLGHLLHSTRREIFTHSQSIAAFPFSIF